VLGRLRKGRKSRKHGAPSLSLAIAPIEKDRSTSESVPASPASSVPSTSEDDKEHRAWKKSIMLLYNLIASHKYASMFLKPITEDLAPGYHTLIKRPIDLSTIKRQIETGVIRTTVEFQRDIMLMFLNALMYNSKTHLIYERTIAMRSDCIGQIQDYIDTQKSTAASSKGPPVIRRETREKSKKFQTPHLTPPVGGGPSLLTRENVQSLSTDAAKCGRSVDLETGSTTSTVSSVAVIGKRRRTVGGTGLAKETVSTPVNSEEKQSKRKRLV